MAETLLGFPFWRLRFDGKGNLMAPAPGLLACEIASRRLTDLFVFAHGWNNDEATAMNLYRGFFAEMAAILDERAAVGLAGVMWPSILFPDGSPQTLETELPKVFGQPHQRKYIRDMAALLDASAPDRGSLLVFRDRLASLLENEAGENTTAIGADDLELQAATVGDSAQWLAVLDALSSQPSADGGAAGFGSVFRRLWSGARNVLRLGTFWQMKNRAGVVGRNGLGPLIGGMHERCANLRVHLLGHSFGARLVSYSLAGLPPATRSPVKSLFLLQGAFSHFAFAGALPFDPARGGDLAGMSAQVDGPLVTTHSLLDLAVGEAYPAASILAGQDAAATTDLSYRWGAMGHDGAQAVSAGGATLGPVGTEYPFLPGQWTNLDGNSRIRNGGPPAGAHGDIVHPETAWAALAAAGFPSSSRSGTVRRAVPTGNER